MGDRDPIVAGVEKVLSILPDNLTEEEKQKVDEIKGLLNNIEKSNNEE